jgi:ubiquinone/menaquinone biosynthesis C-methylase UbiE
MSASTLDLSPDREIKRNRLPDLHELQAFIDEQDDDFPHREYATREFIRGAQYYVDRLKQLSFKGNRALDAGCGVGNWSVAMCETFDRVVALEYNSSRLEFTKGLAEKFDLPITPILGSIEKLPFDDGSFDAVFCNGVIFLTDVDRSLAEFARVLAPGGLLYVGYDGLAWWDHLIFDRGKTSATDRRFGVDAYLTDMQQHLALLVGQQQLQKLQHLNHVMLRTILERKPILRSRVAWRQLAREIKLVARQPGYVGLKRVVRGILMLNSMSPKRFARLQDMFDDEGLPDGVLEVVKGVWQAVFAFMESTKCASGRRLARAFDQIEQFGDKNQKKERDDLLISFFTRGKKINSRHWPVTILEPADMAMRLAKVGLNEVSSGADAGILLAPSSLVPEPMYDSSLGVLETLAQKPKETEWVDLDLSQFSENARRAADFWRRGGLSGLVGTWSSGDDIDKLVSRHARKLTIGNGGKNLIAVVARKLADDAPSSTEILVRINRFVQSAVFHHPTIQLRQEDGNADLQPDVTLLAGIGRCGNVAALAAALLREVGIEAKVHQLVKHLVCLAQIDSRWLVLDCDALKAGVYPTNGDGRWASIDELQSERYLIDRLPAIGLVLSPEAPWSRDWMGTPLSGYVDTGLPWTRPLLSELYFGQAFPVAATPPKLSVVRSSRGLAVRAEESEGWHSLQILVDGTPRGWNYNSYPDEKLLRQPTGDIFKETFDRRVVIEGVDLNISSDAELFLSCITGDSRSDAQTTAFRWPGEEVKIAVIS